ncbi:MAG: carboxymuconolactone decarboxylase family protein [Pseudomonadota bacterium]|nr:carboxymuconolactone decarboxylase family protein [Pseudomonadota bacterium]
MTDRIVPFTTVPDAMKQLADFSMSLPNPLPEKLRFLIQTRASQINGCAFCLDMHLKEARAVGETQQRLDLLETWRETSLFDDRERAALAWTEVVTRLDRTRSDQQAYDDLVAAFGDAEAVWVTINIALINLWNRINAPFHVKPMGM